MISHISRWISRFSDSQHRLPLHIKANLRRIIIGLRVCSGGSQRGSIGEATTAR